MSFKLNVLSMYPYITGKNGIEKLSKVFGDRVWVCMKGQHKALLGRDVSFHKEKLFALNTTYSSEERWARYRNKQIPRKADTGKCLSNW